MSGIKINLAAGYISAFYLVVFDLFLLTLIDTVFARVVCHLYYRRINAGIPILIQSADIPGVTTYLIGRFNSRTNVTILLMKLILLGCIFYIDLGITKFTPTSNIFRTGTFVFNASDSAWLNGQYRSVQRRSENVRQCRIQDGEVTQFYNIAFDLSYGVILDDEMFPNISVPFHEVDDTTIECLSPDFITARYISPGISVIGCSQLDLLRK